MKFIRNEKGFTLIELMVVILIIGILVAIAVPVFNSAKASAQKRACQANMRTIEGAMEAWKAAQPVNAFYPANYGALIGDLTAANGYLKAEPLCPVAGNTYQFDTVNGPAGGGTQSPIIQCTGHGHYYDN